MKNLLTILSFMIFTLSSVFGQGSSMDAVFKISDITTLATGKFQVEAESQRKPDILSVGLGAGLDYGGIGVNVSVFPQKNIGIFGSVGYAIAGVGYNAGLKIRILGKKKVSPFLTGMYGYNAAIKVINASKFDKVFYGPSFGGGIDIRFRKYTNYLTVALLIPIRDADVKDYMDHLEEDEGADFSSGLMPIAISIGYRFKLL